MNLIKFLITFSLFFSLDSSHTYCHTDVLTAAETLPGSCRDSLASSESCRDSFETYLLSPVQYNWLQQTVSGTSGSNKQSSEHLAPRNSLRNIWLHSTCCSCQSDKHLTYYCFSFLITNQRHSLHIGDLHTTKDLKQPEARGWGKYRPS